MDLNMNTLTEPHSVNQSARPSGLALAASLASARAVEIMLGTRNYWIFRSRHCGVTPAKHLPADTEPPLFDTVHERICTHFMLGILAEGSNVDSEPYDVDVPATAPVQP